jgi:hypothetical protein
MTKNSLGLKMHQKVTGTTHYRHLPLQKRLDYYKN